MDTKDVRTKIKTVLAEYLGVEVADIGDDDDFTADLQMEPGSVFEYQERLGAAGFEVNNIDFTEIHNIDDLIDALEGADPDHSGHENE